jgi:hypothetical protein
MNSLINIKFGQDRLRQSVRQQSNKALPIANHFRTLARQHFGLRQVGAVSNLQKRRLKKRRHDACPGHYRPLSDFLLHYDSRED